MAKMLKKILQPKPKNTATNVRDRTGTQRKLHKATSGHRCHPAMMREKVLDSWEDVCAEFGLEFVHVSGSGGKAEGGRNDFGEKTGIFRVLEALESNDWAQADGLGEDDDEDEEDGDRSGEGESRRAATNPEVSTRAELDDPPDLDPESLEFGFDREDFVGLRQAIWSGDREEDGEEGTVDDVQKLEGMMRKLLAVRDMSAGLPEEQRKRMAKKAVGEVMKEL